MGKFFNAESDKNKSREQKIIRTSVIGILTNLKEEQRLRLRARVMLDEAKAERERIAIEKDKLERDARAGLMCYTQIALSEFSKTLKHLYEDLTRLPQTIIEEAQLTPAQAEKTSQAVERLLVELSQVKVELSSTQDTDTRRGDYTSHRTLSESLSALSEIK